jgi:3D (Asp-Asp-Asp) domain-containing protein
MTFVATAYCQRGNTAAGVTVREGIVAADPTLLPLGTLIRIEATGYRDGLYRVLDTGAKIRGHQIDLFISNCTQAKRFGRRTVRVVLVESGK